MLAGTKFQESLGSSKMDLSMVLDYSLCLHELGFGHMICSMVQSIRKKKPSWVIKLQSEIINIKLSINKSGGRLPKNLLLLSLRGFFIVRFGFVEPGTWLRTKTMLVPGQ